MTESNTPSAPLTIQDNFRISEISKAVPGWSGAVQYAFFKSLLHTRPDLSSLLMLGVYRGRDLCFLLDVLQRYFPERKFRAVGVDKFSDGPCDDWPEEKRGLSWEAAGFGPPPSLEAARRNLWPLESADRVAVIHQMSSLEFLADTEDRFDAVYVDTSHDYATVAREIEAAQRVCRQNAVLCGDDYSNAGTWGVIRAVSEAFPTHQLFGNWIWYALLSTPKTVSTSNTVSP